MQTVIETPDFISDAKAARLSEQERLAIVTHLANNPEAGDVIPGTGGARKVRFAGRGKGKRGGFRVITFYSGSDVPIFLLNIFAKGEKINLTPAERHELRAMLSDIVVAYRQGVSRYDQGRKSNPQ